MSETRLEASVSTLAPALNQLQVAVPQSQLPQPTALRQVCMHELSSRASSPSVESDILTPTPPSPRLDASVDWDSSDFIRQYCLELSSPNGGNLLDTPPATPGASPAPGSPVPGRGAARHRRAPSSPRLLPTSPLQRLSTEPSAAPAPRAREWASDLRVGCKRRAIGLEADAPAARLEIGGPILA